jgi:hypothetical protein
VATSPVRDPTRYDQPLFAPIESSKASNSASLFGNRCFISPTQSISYSLDSPAGEEEATRPADAVAFVKRTKNSTNPYHRVIWRGSGTAKSGCRRKGTLLDKARHGQVAPCLARVLLRRGLFLKDEFVSRVQAHAESGSSTFPLTKRRENAGSKGSVFFIGFKGIRPL